MQAGVIDVGSPLQGAPIAFGEALRCAIGSPRRFGVQLSVAGGTFSLGSPVAASAGVIQAGSTGIFPCRHRDPTGPCGSGTNQSNALQVQFGP